MDRMRRVKILEEKGIEVLTVQAGPLRTNCGLIVKGERWILIDAAPGSYEVLKERREQRLPEALLITHRHWDHIYDAAQWHRAGVPVYALDLDAQQIINPDLDALRVYTDVEIEACSVEHILSDRERFEVLGLAVETLWVPGHVEGGAAYYFSELGVVFVGDTLFAGTVGRSDLPGGDKHLLFRSIREKLYTLPDETVLVAGHGRISTIGNEKATNRFIRPTPGKDEDTLRQ